MEKKFRGISDFGGKVFGYYVRENGIDFIIEEGEEIEVRPGSVKQFLGYDKDGNELYEDDVVTNGEYDYRVYLRRDFEFVLDAEKQFCQFVLKNIEE